MSQQSKSDKDGKNPSKRKGRSNPRSKSKKFLKQEPGNYQDAAEIQEKDKGKREGSDCPIRGKHKDNDPEWYNKFPQLVKDAGSFPFAQPVGLTKPQEYTGTETGITAPNKPKTIVPGIMRFDFAPTCDNASRASDPINVAGEALFTSIKNKTSAKTDFQMPDVVKTILAMDSLYILYAHLARAYGICKWYSINNMYVPRALLTSMGFNAAVIMGDLNKFRSIINQMAVDMSAVYVPNNISYISRHIWMCSKVYMDSETTKPQLYYYNPESLLMYEEGTSGTTNGSVLQYVDIPSFSTFDAIINFKEQLLRPIIGSEDIRIISAYMLRAFGEGAQFKVDALSEDYTVEPAYSKEVLSQMENASLVVPRNGVNYRMRGTIVEDTAINAGFIVTNYGLSAQGAAPIQGSAVYLSSANDANSGLSTTTRLLNFHKDSPTPDDVMVGTRMTCIGLESGTSFVVYPDKTNYTITKFKHHGSEVCLGAVIHYFDAVGNMYYEQMSDKEFIYNVNVSTTASGVVNSAFLSSNDFTLMRLGMLSAFDWHPEVKLFNVDAQGVDTESAENTVVVTTARVTNIDSMIDIDVYTFIDDDELYMIHRAALLSLFNVEESEFKLRE